jgi:hypothetical protein
MTVSGGDSVVLQHYTWGAHPSELGQQIYAYSNDSDIAKDEPTESLLGRIVNSNDSNVIYQIGEVRMSYVTPNKVIFTVVTQGRDSANRKVLFSHSIFVSLDDYRRLGASPRILEEYFIRDINVKGKLKPITIPLASLDKEPLKTDLSPNTLKDVLSFLLHGTSVILHYPNMDNSRALKLPSSILEALPPCNRLVPYITAYPEKNYSWFKLIITTTDYDPVVFNKDWTVVKATVSSEFIPRNEIDKAINLFVDLYYRKDPKIKEYHKRWCEIAKTQHDTEKCAQVFLRALSTNVSQSVQGDNSGRKQTEQDTVSDQTADGQNKLSQVFASLVDSTGNAAMSAAQMDFSVQLNAVTTIANYLHNSQLRNNGDDEKARTILKSLIRAMDNTIEKKLLKSTLRKNTGVDTLWAALQPDTVANLLYCLRTLNLREQTGRLKENLQTYISIIFSLEDDELQALLHTLGLPVDVT